MTSKEMLNELLVMPTLCLNKGALRRLKIIEKDLERLEKLEKVTKILKDNLQVYEKADYCLSVNGILEYQKLTKQEYDLLKDWLEND